VPDDDVPDDEAPADEEPDGEVLEDPAPGAATGLASAAGAGGSSAGVLDPFCAARDEISRQTTSAIHSVH
jgi:hypothetical protein